MKKMILAITVMIIFNLQPLLAEDTLPEGPGREIIYDRCQACHKLNVIMEKKRSRDGWKKIIAKMIGFGLKIGDRDKKMVLDYLATYRGIAPSE